MKPWRIVLEAILVAGLVSITGFWGIWQQFSDRTPARAHIGTFSVGGIRMSDVPGAVAAYEQDFLASSLTFSLRGKAVTHTLAELGIGLQRDQVVGDILTRKVRVLPTALLNEGKMRQLLEQDFADVVPPPQNATLKILPDYSVAVIPAAAGERIDTISLNRDIAHVVTYEPHARIFMRTINALPVDDPVRLEALRTYVQNLLNSGFSLIHKEEQFPLSKQDITTLLSFHTVSEAAVLFDEDGVRQYLEREIAPKVHTDALNARFEMQDGRVSQFALSQAGEDLDTNASIAVLQQSLAAHAFSATVAIVQKPSEITDVESTASFGITSLLARGETDFRGSPRNRIHNIDIGVSRYHGLLIAPGQEFSFNEFLGPVNADAGFKPELVIKNNQTTPEFGGGLCQVSTTLFRAAVYSGMKITNRRNHSYAVRYYGTPGFDATVYPPYTDFRFLNNTPGYLLIQTKIDGTRLSFELWGTQDGREVVVDGPHPYNRQPDGAVQATLKQTVTKEGEVLIEDTFRSNYKSPNLFPKV